MRSSSATSVALILVSVVLAVLLTAASAAPTQPQNPIIGIITLPNSECGPAPASIANKTVGCMSSFYVKWLEASGIRVVPFPWNASGAYREKLLTSLNGVLYPGGGLSGEQLKEYFNYTQYIFDYTMQRNQAGDPFFLWGTCEGFQLLSAAAAKDLSVIQGGFPGMYPLMMALNFTNSTQNSRLLGIQSTSNFKGLYQNLQSKSCTLNWHDCGVNDESTAATSFSEVFDVLSTNAAPGNGRVFYSAIEAKKANIYGTQFHPERPPYEFSDDNIGHDIYDVSVSQYLSDFIVQNMRRNSHKFSGGAAEAEKYMMENYMRVNYGKGHQLYWITTPSPFEQDEMNNADESVSAHDLEHRQKREGGDVNLH